MTFRYTFLKQIKLFQQGKSSINHYYQLYKVNKKWQFNIVTTECRDPMRLHNSIPEFNANPLLADVLGKLYKFSDVQVHLKSSKEKLFSHSFQYNPTGVYILAKQSQIMSQTTAVA